MKERTTLNYCATLLVYKQKRTKKHKKRLHTTHRQTYKDFGFLLLSSHVFYFCSNSLLVHFLSSHVYYFSFQRQTRLICASFCCCFLSMLFLFPFSSFTLCCSHYLHHSWRLLLLHHLRHLMGNRMDSSVNVQAMLANMPDLWASRQAR